MRTQRFFLPGVPLELHRLVDISPLAHQLRKVLRLTPGSVITILDGNGAAYPTRIVELDGQRATGSVLAREFVDSEPGVALTLYQCALKRERFEWVLQKCTELGVGRFVPVVSSRAVVRPAAKLLPKYVRWRSIIREAAEQCGRGRLPILEDPVGWDEAIRSGTGVRLLALEEERGRSPGIATTCKDAAEIALLIGPEGGISRDESAAAIECGWQAVSLGPRILRAETAAVAATTLVMHQAGGLG